MGPDSLMVVYVDPLGTIGSLVRFPNIPQASEVGRRRSCPESSIGRLLMPNPYLEILVEHNYGT